ncbi:Aldo/keto reductase [Patellaria atrata CBS 101060]|uniref:Aldo/keto reductase n=1 Tax=Patellaria atrata CBS 101060 TaxID=1346257 RepID=A0A9P4VVU8_9PEZI|nr:Aldo/keto reductase [Patellaria atrata CBS 101060]
MASKPLCRGKPSTSLSSVLPPLIFGTATFNSQYNKDPFSLDTNGLVKEALDVGVRAFDTSPYYGPSEALLGTALNTPYCRSNFPRESYFILTKVGRIAAETFDYSPEWIRQSIKRSLKRLDTDYLDVVYCHDVEHVSPEEVLEAVRTLRRIRDEYGSVKYVGISGYPIDTLCSLAELTLKETGEPLDAVMSYANFTLQNTTLATKGLSRLRAAGVDVVPNASVLGMGLLRRDGVPIGSMGDWHPASEDLRQAMRLASKFCDAHDERLEVIAIRYALESWLEIGSEVGSRGDSASGVSWKAETNDQVGGKKLGVSVMGVSRKSELEKTMMVWRSILDGLEDGRELAIRAGRWSRDHEWSLNRKKAVQILGEGVQEVLDKWIDYVWDSPGPSFVNRPLESHEQEKEQLLREEGKEAALWPTPDASPAPTEVELPMR